jgi:Concanavalin A-like lectin/glucanases superfamily
VKKALPVFIIIIFYSFSLSAQVNLPLGLKAYYPFTGNANDISGNNNNPVFNNATLTADRLGNPNSAYHFNGSTNYMQVANSASLNLPNAMSVSLWVKPTGYNTNQCYGNMLVSKSASTTLPSNFYVRFADVYTGCSSPTTTQERFTGNNAIAATPFVQLNQWYSVVWTSDGTTEKIYVNCELKASVAAGGVPFSNSFAMFFGKQNDPSFPYWFNGDLDEVRIYDASCRPKCKSGRSGCKRQSNDC